MKPALSYGLGTSMPAPAGAAPVAGRRRWWYAAEWVIAYGAVYGLSILTGIEAWIQRISGHQFYRGGTTASVIHQDLCRVAVTFGTVLLTVGVLRWERKQPVALLGLRRAPVRAWAAVGIAFFFTLAAGLGGMMVLNAAVGCHLCSGYPPLHTSQTAHWVDALQSGLTAGFGEEVIVCGFLVVTAEQLGCNQATILAAGITTRLLYHAFYAPGFVLMAVWAVAAIMLFQRYRLLWPMILIHVLWDTADSLTQVSPIAFTVCVAVLLGLFAVGIVWITIATVQERDRIRAGRTAP